MKISNYIMQEAMGKACQSKLKFKVSAIAFDAHGDYLDRARNSHRNGMTGKGKGLHAEMALMKKYGARIKTIIICRVGNSGNLLPIDPCSACAGLAGKLGITIVSIEP